MASACCLIVRPDLLPCKRSLTLPFPHNLDSDRDLDDVGIPRWRSISGDAVNAYGQQPQCHLQCCWQQQAKVHVAGHQAEDGSGTSGLRDEPCMCSDRQKFTVGAGLTSLDKLMLLRAHSGSGNRIISLDPPLGVLTKITCLRLHVCGYQMSARHVISASCTFPALHFRVMQLADYSSIITISRIYTHLQWLNCTGVCIGFGCRRFNYPAQHHKAAPPGPATFGRPPRKSAAVPTGLWRPLCTHLPHLAQGT